MDKKKLDWIISMIREEMMAVGTGEKSLGYNINTETPPVKKRNKYIFPQQKGYRNVWKRKPPQ